MNASSSFCFIAAVILLLCGGISITVQGERRFLGNQARSVSVCGWHRVLPHRPSFLLEPDAQRRYGEALMRMPPGF